LDALHLNGQFDVILGDEHVTHGKPDPEIYLETAKKLQINPKIASFLKIHHQE